MYEFMKNNFCGKGEFFSAVLSIPVTNESIIKTKVIARDFIWLYNYLTVTTVQ